MTPADHDARRPDAPLVLARASYDILGVIPMDAFETTTRVVRAGRTIELVEVTASHASRAAITLRGWMLQRHDTDGIQGHPLPHMPDPDALPAWRPEDVWPGGAIRSIEARREFVETGRSRCWIRPRYPLLDEERSRAARACSAWSTSPTASRPASRRRMRCIRTST